MGVRGGSVLWSEKLQPMWVSQLALMGVRLPPSHRDWETGVLSLGAGWNSNFLWLSFLRQAP